MCVAVWPPGGVGGVAPTYGMMGVGRPHVADGCRCVGGVAPTYGDWARCLKTTVAMRPVRWSRRCE